MNWFVNILENDKRLPPPLIAGLLNVTQVMFEVIETTNNFNIKQLKDFKNNIIDYYYFTVTISNYVSYFYKNS